MLEGGLVHIVDGESEMLRLGDWGLVHPPSHVNHKTDSDGPVTPAIVL